MATKETIYTKDVANKKMKVVREFDAPVEKVWRAWTESELLDQWWAPKPWKAKTVSRNFSNGNTWIYYMEGPEGTRHYCRADFSNIQPQKSFIVLDAFCDEKGKINEDMPRTTWKIEFFPGKEGSRVEIELSYRSAADLEKIIEMGFKEGFAAALNNLDELLAK